MNDKINSFLNKYVIYAIYVLTIMSIFGGCNGCTLSRDNTRLMKHVDSLNVVVKNLTEQTYTKQELDTRMAIEGLETSKRTLYDWNSIVRTVVRPDDRMNEYDGQIKVLREKLAKHE